MGGQGDGKQRVKYHRDRKMSMEEEGSKVELVYTLWDLTVSPIIDNAKVCQRRVVGESSWLGSSKFGFELVFIGVFHLQICVVCVSAC